MKRSIHQTSIQCTFDFDALSCEIASNEIPLNNNVASAVPEKFCYHCKKIYPVTSFREVKSGVKHVPFMCVSCAEEHEYKKQKQLDALGGFKICKTCKESKPLSEFGPECRLHCEQCYVAYARGTQLKYKFNMAYEEYELLLLKQGGACAICGSPPQERKRLYVDHDHKTGFVRELLCHNCNTALGHVHDSPDILRKAALYLEKHSSSTD